MSWNEFKQSKHYNPNYPNPNHLFSSKDIIVHSITYIVSMVSKYVLERIE